MVQIDTCRVVFVDRKKVEAARKGLHPQRIVHLLSDTFKLLGDPTRLKILLALSTEELCVCDLASLLGMTRSAISHQLRLLKSARLVKFRKTGKMVYYSLDDEHIGHLIKDGLEHVRE